MSHHSPLCCILPEDILRRLAEHDRYRQRALHTLAVTERLRGRREILSQFAMALGTGEKRRTLYDAHNQTNLPGTLVRAEGAGPINDDAVNEAYDFSGATYDFYKAPSTAIQLIIKACAWIPLFTMTRTTTTRSGMDDKWYMAMATKPSLTGSQSAWMLWATNSRWGHSSYCWLAISKPVWGTE